MRGGFTGDEAVPGCANAGWQYEVVPQVDEQCSVDVGEHVVLVQISMRIFRGKLKALA